VYIQKDRDASTISALQYASDDRAAYDAERLGERRASEMDVTNTRWPAARPFHL